MVTRTTSSREGEAVGEFAEGVVHRGAEGELVGDLAQFFAGGRLQFLRRHADGGAQGEAGLGGVGEDAGEFGELVDELLDAFLALPVEELDRHAYAEQSGERAEEGGQGGLADQPQARDRGDHVGEELAGGEVQAGRRQAQFQCAAELGAAQAAVQGAEAAPAAGGRELSGGGEPVDQGLALGLAGGVGVHAGDREGAGQQCDAGGEGDEGVEFHRRSYLASLVASWSLVCATPKACGTGWFAM